MTIRTMEQSINIPELKEWASKHVLEICHSLKFYPTDRGRYLTSECPAPYHPGDADNDKAFAWSYDKERWACYTHSCEEQTANDIIGLVQTLTESSFGKALHMLNNWKLKGFDENIVVKTKNVVKRRKAYTKVDKRKLKILLPDTYFHNRGIDPLILKKHYIGYWQREGTFMDKRAIVPIFDIDDNLVGFSGRTLATELEMERKDISKWVHGLDFISHKLGHLDKSNILYNLNLCKDKVKETGTVYIVEGPIDCWKLEMAGITNVIATLGLGMSLQQVNLLIQLNVKKIIICYDKDKDTEAGQRAAIRLKNQLIAMFGDVEIKHPPEAKDYGEMSIEEIQIALK